MALLTIDRRDGHESVPLWLEETCLPVTPALEADAQADVCVVGAGVAGLSTAYELALRGASVVVLERADIASGESGRSTAHLATALDARYFDLERLHGAGGARLVAESHAKAIDRIARVATLEGTDCGFERVDGFLFAGPGDGDEILRRELVAARYAGVAGVELASRAPLGASTPSLCLRFPAQAQLDPVRYLAALARGFLSRRGRIFTATRAMTIEGGREAVVQTAEGHVVTARHVVVATNAPINNLLSVHTKQAAYRTYVVAARAPKGSVPLGLYWDTGDPFHYLRLDTRDPRHDAVIVGGEDHKTGHEEDLEERWRRLEAWLAAHVPSAEPVASRWSGQIMRSVDGLAYIGRNPRDADNVWIATGDSGSGITHGAIAGIVLAALISGEAHPWARLYDPSRVTLGASRELFRQNLDAVEQYARWMEAGDIDDEEGIPRGRGAVVREGVRLLAVYRDERGALHRCSAVCPHLGGIVQWNGAEGSWDCPCHGSRFDSFGHVIRGPANVDLLRVDEPREEASRADEPEVSPLFGLLPTT